MAFSTSDVNVANMALDLLKEGIMVSFDDDRPAAKWMNRNYAVIRDMTLAANPWRFAVVRAQLAESSTIPIFGYNHQYLKPSDCIRVLPVRYLGQTNGALVRYSVEGNYILTDHTAPLKIRYISRVLDASLFSPLFINAFTTAMAMRLAIWLTGKESVTADLKASYKDSMTMAIFTDSAEGYAEDQVADAYDNARFYSQAITYPSNP